MTDKQDDTREDTSPSLASFSLQARLESTEIKYKNLEQSLLELRSSYAFRVGRLVVAPAAYLLRKFRSYKKPALRPPTNATYTKECSTEGPGGYLLSVELDDPHSASSLKIDFCDAAGNCRYYYQFSLCCQAFVDPSAPGTPVIRQNGTQTSLEVVLYIGSEIACLRAFILHPQGDQIACHSLSISQVSNSGGFHPAVDPTKHTEKKAQRIACILDEFTLTCLSPEANLVQLKPDDDWQAFDWADFDFLLIESAWRGEAGLWRGALGGENIEARERLEVLLASCRKSGVPSVFWNKEDPVHYEYFKSIAAQFDHIFTTDESVVEKYRNELSNPDVYCLPFFIQPALHNPIKCPRESINKICFAGTWYGAHHLDRTKAMQALLDAAVPLGLDIYDRMYLDPTSDYRFPLRYWQLIRGKLSYDELCDAHKYYACFINVNTVTDSPSMCARRVFEVLASSTPVVSNPSLSLKRYFNGGVFSASSQEQASVHFRRLLSDSTYRAMQGHLGFRAVMSEHTAQQRLALIAEKVLQRRFPVKSERNAITIVSIASCEQDIQSTLDTMRKFSIPGVKLRLGTTFQQGTQTTLKLGENSLVVPIAESNLPGYQTLLNGVGSRFAVIINPKMDYGANYINDKLLCFTYIGEPIAYTHPRFFNCKNDIVCLECVPEQEFTHQYDSDSLVLDLENEFWNSEVQTQDAGWFENAISRLSADKRIYAADSFNFIKSAEGPIPGAFRERLGGYTEQDIFI